MAYQQYNQWIPMSRLGAPKTGPQDFSYKPDVTSQTLEVPLNEAEDAPSYRTQSFQQKYLGGVKRTLRAFTIVSISILAVNVGWMLYAKAKYGIVDGYGTIQQGDCESVKRTNTYLHLAINILSTLLLTGSNAFMAAYSGPTRKEIDQAHARRRWLHVGSMSLRNMRSIAKRKSLVVLVLALSSVPFHLLYNSLVFTSLSANNYYWAVVTEEYVTGAPYNLTGPLQWVNSDDPGEGQYFDYSATLPNDADVYYWDLTPHDVDVMNKYWASIQKSAPSWDRLDQKACINAYTNVFVSSRRNVMLVSKTKNDTNSVLTYGSADIPSSGSDLDSNWWLCSEAGQDGGSMTCNPRNYLANATSWKVWGYDVDYCLSEPVQDTCSLQFSLDIMIVVVVFNALKVVAMAWVLLRLDAEHILTSVGDAASSFLKQPDMTTLGMCLAHKRQIDAFWTTPEVPRLYSDRTRNRWGQAVSRKRWICFFLLMIFAFCVVFFFGAWGFVHVKDQGVSLDPSSLWALGFGTINQNTMVFAGNNGNGDAVAMSVLANTPQAVLALIYLMYMGVMSAMFVAADWATFASTPQTLMVSTPAGKQRGTWLLGAPLAYGIGLLALQTLLHWFVSQSIFVVQMTVYNKLGQLDLTTPTFSNCGYSPVAIIFSVVASGLLCVTAMVAHRRTFRAGSPPVASTCSAAISAACHAPLQMRSEALVYSELRWGVTGHGQDGVGHCSLGPSEAWDSGIAKAPVEGWAYAGITHC